MIAVDTNLLIYAHRVESASNARAQQALSQAAANDLGWAIPWPCIHEFLSVVTGPAFGKQATPFTYAVDTVQAWANHPRCTLLNEAATHLATLVELCKRANLRGGAVHDARIATLCIDHQVTELWTCDRDFSRFPDLQVRNPLIPSLHEPVPKYDAMDG